MKSFLAKHGLTAISLIAPVLVAAQNNTLPSPPFTDPGGAITIICTIAGWIFAFLVVLAVVFVLLAAWDYLTAGGEAEKISSANNKLIYAAVAIAVALFARGFPLLIVGFVGGQGVTDSCT